jgi:hypothetical protein
MDPSPLDPQEAARQARRAKMILYVLMVVLVAGPIVVYMLIGKHAIPRQ